MAEEKGRNGEVKKVEDILTVVSEKVPSLIGGIIGTLFSESAGREMGKAVAAFYSELKTSELPDEVAMEMTKDYFKSLTNLGQHLRNLKS